ncbi:chitobiosyldiphosphodolichol beta-mannosyltransferase [Xylogone sp. PMI_703]|nr:chitobiosyldiphosphodolichol beta-mannosyltransferase [Xylogone sp. PMI_703]
MLDELLTLAVVASTIFTIFLLMLPSRYVRHSPPQETTAKAGDGSNTLRTEPKISVQVLVLGDIGRSPRMQYHAMSIAKHGGRVDLIGYQESAIPPSLDNPLITIVPLALPPPILRSKALPFIIAGPLKVLWQIYTLFHVIGYRTKPARWLLVQNPPSIPTLLIALVVCFLRNTHLIIDWHNYGWSILAGTKGAAHPFVRISKAYEIWLGQWAPTASFTVTDAMAKQLRGAPYYIRSPIFTLHDRPAAIFQPIESPEARLKFLQRVPETKEYANSIIAGKTKLLVSSTSWTPDEDFDILLSALVSYSSSVSSAPSSDCLPPLLAIITGKGPQKAHYLAQIAELKRTKKLEHVTISTAWLSIEDYATLLACADLGVCLHMSSSGVDLPMKVVDMFGAGLPVAGYNGYESWSELVHEGENGEGFKNAEGLATILKELFSPEDGGRKLAKLRKGAVREGSRRWDEEWDGVAGKLLGFCD